MGPQAALLPDGRLHLHHGPIDLVIMAEAQSEAATRTAFRAARDRFATVLDELVPELPLLRAPLGALPAGSDRAADAPRLRDRGAGRFRHPHGRRRRLRRG